MALMVKQNRTFQYYAYIQIIQRHFLWNKSIPTFSN